MLKRLCMILAIMMFIHTLPTPQVQAATEYGSFSFQRLGYTYQFDSSFPAPFGNNTNVRNLNAYFVKENGSGNVRQTYCIEYGVNVSTGSDLSHQNNYDNLNADQKTLLNKALIMGYSELTGTKYGGSWEEETMATQALVWIIANGQYDTQWESRIADVILSGSPRARSIYNTLRGNVADFATIPSFTAGSSADAPTHELKYNMTNGRYELTLADANQVLKYFDFTSPDVTFTRSGNKLTISTTKELKNITIRADRKLPKDTYPTLLGGEPEFWTHDTWQDLVSLNVQGETLTIPAVMKLKTENIGHINIVKTSEDQVVAGLNFQITGNGIDQTVTTGKNGEMLVKNLVAGDYTITEVDTPNRYVQPQKQVVTVKPGKTTAVTFSNTLKKFHIHITKTDAETGDTAQGDATLDGAVYEIYDAKGNLVDTVTAEGNIAKSKLLVLGTYTVHEVEPPIGYNVNKNPVTVTGDYEGQTVEIGRADTGVQDDVIKGQIALVKFADQPLTGDAPDGGIKQPLEQIEFTVTRESTGETVCTIATDADGYAITPLLPYGTYRVAEVASDHNAGYQLIEPFEVMVDTQNKVYKYILENTVYETEVKIVKVDAETGQAIPLEGTTFKIKNAAGNWVTQSYNYPTPTTLEEFQTAADGTLVLPEPLRSGDYWLYEIKAPYGYTVSTEPIPFTVSADNPSVLLEVTAKNSPVKGTVTVEKLGEYLTGFEKTEHDVYGNIFTPIYKVQGIPGTVYDVVAVTDITTPDGTIRKKAGEVVATLTTGSDGRATSEALYLGQYQLMEKSVPEGFVLDSTPIPFELTYEDQDTAIISETKWVENQQQKAAVSLLKVAETVENQNYNPYMDIRFGLYSAADLLDAKGNILLTKDSLLEVLSLDEQGQGLIQTDLPFADYYVKELAAGEGYERNETMYPFTLEHTTTDIPVVEIQINDGTAIPNALMRGSLRITKTAEDQKIEGISFQVTGESVNGTPYESTVTTDKNGLIEIPDLLIGTYEITEIANDKTAGYILPNGQTITVIADETSEVIFHNALIHGGFSLEKVDDKNGDRLAGAVFGLYTREGKLLKEFEVTDGTYQMDGLLYGSYYLLEHTAPKGYELSDTPYPFAVVEDGKTIEIIAENQKTPKPQPKEPTSPTTESKQEENVTSGAPKTGDDTNLLIPGLLLILSLSGLAFLLWKRRS